MISCTSYVLQSAAWRVVVIMFSLVCVLFQMSLLVFQSLNMSCILMMKWLWLKSPEAGEQLLNINDSAAVSLIWSWFWGVIWEKSDYILGPEWINIFHLVKQKGVSSTCYLLEAGTRACYAFLIDKWLGLPGLTWNKDRLCISLTD